MCVLLQDGIEIGGRHFAFLGYSMSALRTHTFWFLNPFRDSFGDMVDSDYVTRRIGAFSLPLRGKTPIDHYPALFPARAAQAFSATEASILICRKEILEELDDVKNNGHTFTDGVGRISPELAFGVWQAILVSRDLQVEASATNLPSAFQIRLCGFKGVLVVDYRIEGRAIHFRKSMKKFDVYDWDDPEREWPLEIANVVMRPATLHLNR